MFPAESTATPVYRRFEPVERRRHRVEGWRLRGRRSDFGAPQRLAEPNHRSRDEDYGGHPTSQYRDHPAATRAHNRRMYPGDVTIPRRVACGWLAMETRAGAPSR